MAINGNDITIKYFEKTYPPSVSMFSAATVPVSSVVAERSDNH